ncbi:hypothetical protein [Nonomuraea sp. NPDC048916]
MDEDTRSEQAVRLIMSIKRRWGVCHAEALRRPQITGFSRANSVLLFADI